MSPERVNRSHPNPMRLAVALARQGYGTVSPNPMVGAVLVRQRRVIGEGWHQRAGGPHAEVRAIRNARSRGENPQGSTLYVTLEPCSTRGRTPPCTDAILKAGIDRVIVATTDPNPDHAGQAFPLLRQAGVTVRLLDKDHALAREARDMNESFNHWIRERTPLVTVKAAMTLDGKIATHLGESKWITGPESRGHAMHLRQGQDAILVGIQTVLQDNPGLTVRLTREQAGRQQTRTLSRGPRRIILDSLARTPLTSQVVTDRFADRTVVVTTDKAPRSRVTALKRRVSVLLAPKRRGRIDLEWLLRKLGDESVTSLLVEGGGEINAAFLLGGHAHRVAFFYAPRILGGRRSVRSVGGRGAPGLEEAVRLRDVHWRKLGVDLLLTARIAGLES